MHYKYFHGKIWAVYRDGSITESTVHKWFRSRNIDLEEWEHSSRVAVINEYQTEILIKNNPSQTT